MPTEPLKTGCFYVYDEQAVVIRQLMDDGTARIEYIQRTKPKKQEIVPQKMLERMTPDLIQKLRLKYNRIITQCNLRLHAIHECEQYMD